ncbi:UNVERIFIED_ORG: DNA-binding CsgD family transcriptional regulator [Sphingomonas sp. R1F5B]
MSGEGVAPMAHQCFLVKGELAEQLTSAERDVLNWLASGPASAAELAARMKTTANTINVLVCRLRKKGISIYSPRKASQRGTRKGVDQCYRLGDGA